MKRNPYYLERYWIHKGDLLRLKRPMAFGTRGFVVAAETQEFAGPDTVIAVTKPEWDGGTGLVCRCQVVKVRASLNLHA